MKARWQDWTNVLLGLWLVVSPWQMEYSLDKIATINACGLGTVLAVFNLISACRLLDEGQEILNILLGVWLALSPYSLGFAMDRGPAINAHAAGAAIMALAIWQIYDAIRGGRS